MSRHLAFVPIAIAVLFVTPLPAKASDDHGAFHPNEFGVFLGATAPEDKAIAGKADFTVGFDYERRFTPNIGVVALVDFVGSDHKRTGLYALKFAYHAAGFRLAAGPGFELVEKDKPDGGTKHSSYFVIAMRVNYGIHLDRALIAPTLGIDLVGETQTNYVMGITIGYGF